MLGLAIAITAQAFAGKRDKGGKPYVLHCLRVMNAVKNLGEDAMCAAVMHDLVEDSDYTFPDLFELGFNQEVIQTVNLLTHPEGMGYDDYISRLASHPVARAIKMVDLRDNSDLFRLKGVTKKDTDRAIKYHRSYLYLSQV